MSDIPIFFRFKPGFTSLTWEFKDPDTGYRLGANSRAALVKQIILYRLNNGLEAIENLDIALEHYLCSLPENAGLCRKDAVLNRGFLAYVRGGITLFKSMLYQKFASQKEADERAKTCVMCPHNIFPDKGGFVKWSDNVARASVQSRKSSLHNDLGNCGLCSCCLKAKVWLHKDLLELPKEELEKMPEYCWQKQEILSKIK